MLLLYVCRYTRTLRNFSFYLLYSGPFPKFPVILALPAKAKIHLPALLSDTSVSQTRVQRYIATVVPSVFWLGLKAYICKLHRFLQEWKGQSRYDPSGHRLRWPQNETGKWPTVCVQKHLLHLYSMIDWFTLTVILAGAVCLKENCFQWLRALIVTVILLQK